MIKFHSALLLALSALPSPTLAKEDESFNRADAVGCLVESDYCGANTGGSTCCINYYVPFCGTCEDYGACAPEGSIECMSDATVPIVLSAEELSEEKVDAYIAAAGPAWEACLEKIAAGGTVADCPRPVPSTSSVEEETPTTPDEPETPEEGWQDNCCVSSTGTCPPGYTSSITGGDPPIAVCNKDGSPCIFGNITDAPSQPVDCDDVDATSSASGVSLASFILGMAALGAGYFMS